MTTKLRGDEPKETLVKKENDDEGEQIKKTEKKNFVLDGIPNHKGEIMMKMSMMMITKMTNEQHYN